MLGRVTEERTPPWASRCIRDRVYQQSLSADIELPTQREVKQHLERYGSVSSSDERDGLVNLWCLLDRDDECSVQSCYKQLEDEPQAFGVAYSPDDGGQVPKCLLSFWRSFVEYCLLDANDEIFLTRMPMRQLYGFEEFMSYSFIYV